MAKLKNLIDKETQQFVAQPTFVVQDIVPADDVSLSILEHARFGYQFTSLTPLNQGPHGGRILMLYHYVQRP